MNRLEYLKLDKVKIQDHFWNQYTGLVAKEIIPFQWRLINDSVPGAQKSYCIHNFRVASGVKKGRHKGEVFQDTDVAKWLEAVAYVLEQKFDSELAQRADGAIELIAGAQCDDGYLNTYYYTKTNERWSDLYEGHELYTAGHMIEAAVAYTEATGKEKFLEVVCRMADNICDVFGQENGKLHGYPGHPEIELALVRLYRLTGRKRYLNLAKYFIEVRGQQPCYFKTEVNYRKHTLMFPEFAQFGMDYCQADRPLLEQEKAEGHAVRAVYLYSAMADIASELDDRKLLKQCAAIWNNITECQMYITGSIGSASVGERFTTDYDLPNNTNYSESCATVGLMMFSHRMFQATREGKYMDVLEQALYNTLLAGIALDGKHFFYVNPMEIVPEDVDKSPITQHISAERQPWFGVACCPPNIARTLASIGKYMFSVSDDTVFINLYIAGQVNASLQSGTIQAQMDADYPNRGDISIRVLKVLHKEFCVALRIPEFSTANYSAFINEEKIQTKQHDGYIYIRRRWNKDDTITLKLDVSFRYIYCNPKVRANIGRVCIMKGPWVYCLEEIDNGKFLEGIEIDTSVAITELGPKEGVFGCVCAKTAGMRIDYDRVDEKLYSDQQACFRRAEFKAVPYCIWNNRGKGEMKVWIRKKSGGYVKKKR